MAAGAGAEVQPVISVRGLGKTYASGQRALDHVDLDIRRGEIFALLGPNGAGKTTLLSVAAAALFPSAGSVWLLGERFGEADLGELRTRIGLSSSSLGQCTLVQPSAPRTGPRLGSASSSKLSSQK